jgi:hypothetical protein
MLLGSILAGCASDPVTRWHYSWQQVRNPSDPSEVALFDSANDVPYPYVELGHAVVSPREASKGMASLDGLKSIVRHLKKDAAKAGASGLILSNPDSGEFPMACLGKKSKEPRCDRLRLIEAVAIAHK